MSVQNLFSELFLFYVLFLYVPICGILNSKRKLCFFFFLVSPGGHLAYVYRTRSYSGCLLTTLFRAIFTSHRWEEFLTFIQNFHPFRLQSFRVVVGQQQRQLTVPTTVVSGLMLSLQKGYLIFYCTVKRAFPSLRISVSKVS